MNSPKRGDADSGDGSSLSDAAAEEVRPDDLRVGSHEDLGVHVDRELLGHGHLARGGKTRYSKLSFRSVGRPRGDQPAEAHARSEEEDAPAELAGHTEGDIAPTETGPPADETKKGRDTGGSLLKRISRLFG